MTGEVVFYAVHFVLFYFVLVPRIGGKVRALCEGNYRCRAYLRQTWLGYTVDLADNQWRDLRGSLVLLWSAMIFVTAAHWLLRHTWGLATASSSSSSLSATHGAATASAIFRLVVGLAFLAVQHGAQALVVLLICYVGYRLAVWQREAGITRSSAVTWIYALAVILFKESYRVQHLPGLRFLRPVFDRNHGGMYGWQLPANFLVLRIISFSLDLQWAGRAHDERKEEEDGEEEEEEGGGGTPRSRSSSKIRRGGGREGGLSLVPSPSHSPRPTTATASDLLSSPPPSIPPATSAEETPRPLDQYNLVNYLSYMLYAPLYTAGPIISFNAFVENTHHPQRAEDPVRYGLRWLVCLCLMELLTASFPFFAVIKSGLFPFLSCAELAVVAYTTLKMMWLKFLIVWRFFRLWAMADGTLAPENMRRCMSNNHSLEQFWKGWHSSFNRWIVRYMYKPLGGRESRIWSVWPIFLFVAVWHDIEMKLLVWGLLNAFFFVLEVLAKRVAASETFSRLPSAALRLIFILSGATYILVLVGVNLVGYAGLGVGGTAGMLQKLVSWDGLVVVFSTYYFLSIAVAFMSFLRRSGLSQE